MNVASSVKDVALVQVDPTALILSCVDPVTKLARMYSCLSSQVESDDLAQIGMLRVCEMALQLYPVADTQERLVRLAGRAMLDEIKLLSLPPTVSLEAYLASAFSDSFVADPFSGTLLTLVKSSDIAGHAFGQFPLDAREVVYLDGDEDESVALPEALWAEYVASGPEQELEVLR